jgi:hypothetical protein
MTRKLINRRTAGALTAALALGAAGSAAARPFELERQGPVVHAGYLPHHEKANVFPPDMPPLHMPYYGEVLPPFVPAHMKGFPETTAAPVPTASAQPTVSHPAPGSDLTYVLIGGVVIGVAGLGGTLAANRRRAARTATPARPRIAG